MVLKSYTGFAKIDPTDPRAQGVCDRCGFVWNLRSLSFQYEWSGTQLRNTRFLVCKICMDVPNIQNKTLILPPDPKPLLNARPEPYTQYENDYRVTEDTDQRITQSDQDRIIED